MNNVEEAKRCLIALGSAWRGDWGDFDGRTLRSQLNDIVKVLDGELSYDDFCRLCWINPATYDWVAW